MRRFVYLAGPILHCTEFEANDWRGRVDRVLRRQTDGLIRGISPLRCEPIHGETYVANYPDEKFGSSRAIMNKNMFDVKNCDMVLAYLPKPPDGRQQSWGTLMEIGWARAFDKPVVLVTDDPKVVEHPVLNACAGWVLPHLDDGLDVVVGILSGYVGGKNV